MARTFTLPDELNILIIEFLKQLGPDGQLTNFQVSPLTQDGSARLYYRITCPGKEPFIAVDAKGTGQKEKHSSGLSQNQSFLLIRNHLAALSFPVPGLLAQNPNGDFYLLQDLGGTTLYQAVKKQGWSHQTINLYQNTISLLLRLQSVAVEKFDPSWCYAGAYYDQTLIIDHELNYFLNAFVLGYCGQRISPETRHKLQDEFKSIAVAATTAPGNFFLYRDFQSKNLMLKDKQIFLIDFQGARLGPYYYDAAALINDPYTDIPWSLRDQLKADYFNKLVITLKADAPDLETFNYYFSLFSLIRTLQTLGAFGYLTSCNKEHFKDYIKPALKNLHHYLNKLSINHNLQTLASLPTANFNAPLGGSNTL